MRGLVHIYTGDGKGKTTSVFGLAIRALAHGKKIYIGQFMKGQPYGETLYLKDDQNIEITQYGWRDCIRKDEVGEIHRKIVEDGLSRCAVLMLSNKYDLVILDEIIVTVWFGLIDEKKLLEFIDIKPYETELVLTGRYASEALIGRADLVTEMRKIKHPYDKGIEAKAGIEY